jgi:hypothetical protein
MACLGRCHAPIKSRRDVPDRRRATQRKQVRPRRPTACKESQLAASRSLSPRPDVTAQSKQQACKRKPPCRRPAACRHVPFSVPQPLKPSSRAKAQRNHDPRVGTLAPVSRRCLRASNQRACGAGTHMRAGPLRRVTETQAAAPLPRPRKLRLAHGRQTKLVSNWYPAFRDATDPLSTKAAWREAASV